MEDICVVCLSHPATVRTNCPHHCRVLCRQDYEMILQSNNPSCPICREPINAHERALTTQLRDVTLRDYESFQEQYPYGVLLFQEHRIIADDELIRVVREAMRAVQANFLDYKQFKRTLGLRLTVAQMELAYVELIQDDNLHGVLQRYDSRLYDTAMMTEIVQEFMVHLIHDTNNSAIASRAIVGTIIDAAVTASTGGLNALVVNTVKIDIISNSIVFGIFAAVEIYRWAVDKDPNRTSNLVCNLGEHAVGMVAAGGAAFALAPVTKPVAYIAGTACGAAIGSVVPVVGTAAGALVGGFVGVLLSGLVLGGLADYAARKVYRMGVKNKKVREESREVQVEVKLSPEEIKEKAARELGISTETDDFEVAQMKFRKLLLRKHPDKFPHATPEEKYQRTLETQDIIASWQVVREYYHRQQRLDEVSEAFIMINVVKVLDAATNTYRIVRSWLGHDELDEPLAEDEEMIQMEVFL